MTSAEMVVVGMKHIVCFSGGHSSAIAAVEVVRKFGAEDTILLNHDLCPRTEDADIKRFKKQVSDYLGVPITYANMPGWDVMAVRALSRKSSRSKGRYLISLWL